MKIGLLTYHAVCNFGANLQALSTVSYFRKRGIDIEIINWRPDDLEKYYDNRVTKSQRMEHEEFINKFLPTSPVFKTLSEVETYVNTSDFDAFIIGSDAVFNYHPFLTRFYPSRKTLIKYLRPTSDHRFPNPFWGMFRTNAKIIGMSVCAQALNYKVCLPYERKMLRGALRKFDYISARDRWAKRIIKSFAPEIDVEITPDPVFGIVDNAPEIESNDVLGKYGLTSKYVVLSFCSNSKLSAEWFEELYVKLHDHGYQVVNLAMPEGCVDIKCDKAIDVPLNVNDWYNIIRLSSGYIGQRMHPMIVALVNYVPVFIFDHYVIRGTNDVESSKIYDILERADLVENYYNIDGECSTPTPDQVVNRLIKFDGEKERLFVKAYRTHYAEMMDNITKRI